MTFFTTALDHLRSLFNGAALLIVCTLIVNAGNYAINVLLGKYLGPAFFAEANVIATIVMTLSFVAVGIQLTVAKYAAVYQADCDLEKLEALKHMFTRAGKRLSLYALPVLILLTPLLTSYIQLGSVLPLLILFLGVPLYVLMSISRGYYQGTNQFNLLALSLFSEMLTRLVITGVLLYFFSSSSFITEIVALGFLCSFIVTYTITRLDIKKVSVVLPIMDIKRFMAVIGIYELSQILINNSDIILVKHFMDAESAGLYAGIALIGKVVFFATWTIVTLLFPKVIEKERRGENHKALFWGALLFVLAVGMMITTACYFYDEQIITTVFSKEYLSSSSLLWIYALMTCLFAGANVFAYYHMSLNNYTPVKISIVIGVLQILGIYLIHHSLYAIILVQLTLMSLLLVAMILYHLTYSRNTAPSYQLQYS